MGLLPNKSGLLIGSIVGSVVGLLFAREAGKNLRARLAFARTPQKKFEVIFQEYLKVGNAVFKEVESHELVRDIVTGGRDVLAELKKRAATEGTHAVKFAESKTNEILAEAEKLVGTASSVTKKTIAHVAKKTTRVAARATRTVTKVEKKAKKTVAVAKKNAKKITRTTKAAKRKK